MVPASGDALEEVSGAALRAVQALEAQLVTLAGRAEQVRNEVDAVRARIQRDREELDIEYSLETGSSYVIESPHSAELRNTEFDLTQQTIRAAALHRQLNELTSLVAASVRQLAQGETAEVDAATQASIRAAAVAAQESERNRLAREIHDGPAQALANAIIALEFVERAIRNSADGSPLRALEEVERVKSTLREGLTEIRRFIFDLRPTMLQDRGLVATVEHYIATYQSLFPMAIDFRASGTLPHLTADQELAAFRVIQESIQNARKHARASRVQLNIAEVNHELVVSITDDGRGFSPDRVTTHIMSGVGLRGMEERAALIGGSIQIRSTLGEGTTIELRVPIGNPAITGSAAAEPGAHNQSEGLSQPADRTAAQPRSA